MKEYLGTVEFAFKAVENDQARIILDELKKAIVARCKEMTAEDVLFSYEILEHIPEDIAADPEKVV